MSKETTLVENTSFKTRDQYAVFEHINGPLAIQIACFIMLAIPMYKNTETLNWEKCSANYEIYSNSADSFVTKCKDEYEYGVAYTEEYYKTKSVPSKKCVELVETFDDCHLFFRAVHVMILNIICIVGALYTNKFSNIEREHKLKLEEAKNNSTKAILDKASTHNIVKSWAVIIPTFMYLF